MDWSLVADMVTMFWEQPLVNKPDPCREWSDDDRDLSDRLVRTESDNCQMSLGSILKDLYLEQRYPYPYYVLQRKSWRIDDDVLEEDDDDNYEDNSGYDDDSVYHQITDDEFYGDDEW